LTVSGSPYDPLTHEIQINAGWNYLGFIPQVAMTIDEALAYMQPSHGDVIKGHGKFAVYIDNLGWIGSLTTLRPTEGYVLHSQLETSLIYPNYSSISSSRIATSPAMDLPNDWSLNKHDFQSDMSIMANISEEDEELLNGDEMLLIFSGEHLRGTASPLELNGDNVYFISAFGKNQDEMSFKLYSPSTKEVYTVINSIRFQPNAIVGSTDSLYEINLIKETVSLQLPEVNVWPNPFNQSFHLQQQLTAFAEVNVTLLDLSGNILHQDKVTAAENGELLIDFNESGEIDFETGLYIIRLESSDKTEVIKVLKN